MDSDEHTPGMERIRLRGLPLHDLHVQHAAVELAVASQGCGLLRAPRDLVAERSVHLFSGENSDAPLLKLSTHLNRQHISHRYGWGSQEVFLQQRGATDEEGIARSVVRRQHCDGPDRRGQRCGNGRGAAQHEDWQQPEETVTAHRGPSTASRISRKRRSMSSRRWCTCSCSARSPTSASRASAKSAQGTWDSAARITSGTSLRTSVWK